MSDFEEMIEYLNKEGIDFYTDVYCRGYLADGYAIFLDKDIIKFDSNGNLENIVDYEN